MELYRDHGFDQTTTAEIAALAGVNERTYFRHFPDKREVLFDGEAELRSSLMQAVADAPDGLQPFEILLSVFQEAGRALEANHSFAQPRHELIATTPALRERELAKHASLTDAVAEALQQRGVPTRLATLAAQTAWATYRQAVQAWTDDPTRRLDLHLTDAFDDLRKLSAAAQPTTPTS